MPPAVCCRCGANSADDGPPLGWSVENDRGKVSHVCESCTRENVRSIEAKLEEEWW